MGMFSFECKGCDQELKMDEEVRLNGCKGIYDGYGRAGNFDYDGGGEPVAWHQKCYHEATDAEKLVKVAISSSVVPSLTGTWSEPNYAEATDSPTRSSTNR